MAGLVPAIHVLLFNHRKTWMPGTRPGMTSAFDPRLTPARPDLAAKHLQGKVTAAKFVDGVVYEIYHAQTPVTHTPDSDAPMVTEALLGERITIYEMTDEGWAWGQLENDGYVGWLPESALVSAA
jgi:hypothetical protein